MILHRLNTEDFYFEYGNVNRGGVNSYYGLQ